MRSQRPGAGTTGLYSQLVSECARPGCIGRLTAGPALGDSFKIKITPDGKLFASMIYFVRDSEGRGRGEVVVKKGANGLSRKAIDAPLGGRGRGILESLANWPTTGTRTSQQHSRQRMLGCTALELPLKETTHENGCALGQSEWSG